MENSFKKNRRKVQLRNYWAYHNRRQTLQPQGGYDSICSCGKAVEYCPECEHSAGQDTATPEDADFFE